MALPEHKVFPKTRNTYRALPHILLLVLVTAIWGTSFPILKTVVFDLKPSLLLALRFGSAALVFLPWLPLSGLRTFGNASSRENKNGSQEPAARETFSKRSLWRDAFLISLPLFFSFFSQIIGLLSISSNRAAFITGLSVVLVPLFAPFFSKRLSLGALVAALIAFGGIVLMSFEGALISVGDLWVLGCAVSFAIYILMLERIAHRYDIRRFSAAQMLLMAGFSIIWVFLDGAWSGFAAAIQVHGLAILYLGIIGTALINVIQLVAQRHVSAELAAIIYTLEPVFASIFAWWWLGEILGLRGLLGGGLIVLAMIMSSRLVR